jgi:hypothetical protein
VELGESSRACPACGQPLFGWLELDTLAGPTLLERCENCRLGLAAGLTADDVSHELLAQARRLPDGRLELEVANRDSIAARLGGQNWAALDPGRGLYPTPEALRLLAPKAGLEIVRLGSPRRRRALLWMWQTIVNAFTFNQNFALKVRRGELHPSGFAEQLKYGTDAVVTVLATPLVLLVAIPMELIAEGTGSGGLLVAVTSQSSDEYEKVDQ